MDREIGRIAWEIRVLERNLAETNNEAIMFAAGELTAEEFAETKAQRKEWRAKINTLEAQLQALRT